MKLNSQECKDALSNYNVTNDMEGMAINVLITEPKLIPLLPGLGDYTSEQLDELTETIIRIRKELDIEVEA